VTATLVGDKVVLTAKISGCAEKAATLDKDIKRALKAAQRSCDQPDASGGQGRGGVNAEIYTVAYTFSHF
jgi:hypothetical protein